MAAAATGEGGSVAPETTRVEAASSPQPGAFPGSTARAMPYEECVAGIRSALKHPTVRFLKERLEKAGCPVFPGIIKAATCSTSGSYVGREGVKVCCNHMLYQDSIEQTIIHELIHAYDDCVTKNIDWKNCAHHACSEIRANHLSGNCHYKRELLKGFMKIRGHEPVIYHLLEEMGRLIVGKAPGAAETQISGEAEVLNIFELKGRSKSEVPDIKIAGCRITDGHFSRCGTMGLLRSGDVVFESPCTSLKREKQDVDMLRQGFRLWIGYSVLQSFPG